MTTEAEAKNLCPEKDDVAFALSRLVGRFLLLRHRPLWVGVRLLWPQPISGSSHQGSRLVGGDDLGRHYLLLRRRRLPGHAGGRLDRAKGGTTRGRGRRRPDGARRAEPDRRPAALAALLRFP